MVGFVDHNCSERSGGCEGLDETVSPVRPSEGLHAGDDNLGVDLVTACLHAPDGLGRDAGVNELGFGLSEQLVAVSKHESTAAAPADEFGEADRLASACRHRHKGSVLASGGSQLARLDGFLLVVTERRRDGLDRR
jgi:hypothetical protein